MTEEEAKAIAEAHTISVDDCELCGHHFHCWECNCEVDSVSDHLIEKLAEAGAFT